MNRADETPGDAAPQAAREALALLTGLSLVESALDVVSFGLIVVDPEERVVLWSRWLETVSDVSFAQARGRGLSEIFPELATGRVMQAVRGALREGFPATLSQSLNKAPFPLFGKLSPKGGKERLQQKINVLPLRSAGVTSHCLIEIYDVSLAVRREIALSEQKKFLSSILESDPECVAVLSPNGAVLQMNRAGLAMIEVGSLDEMHRRGICSFVLPAYQESFTAMCRRAVSGESGVLEFEIVGAKGTRRWLEAHVSPMRGEGGETMGILAVTRDITERRLRRMTNAFFHTIDQMVLQGSSRKDLLNFICDECVRIFGYPVVWVGRKRPGGVVEVIAHAGSVSGYFSALGEVGVRWDRTPQGQGPAGQSVRTGKPQYAKVSDASFAPWRAAATAHGLCAYLSIPLILRGEVYGCFTVISRSEDQLSGEETLRQLSGVATRVCVALERAMDHDQLRLLQSALATAANGVFITDRQGRIQWLNRAFLVMTGYTEDEALGATPRLLRVGNDSSFFEDMLHGIAAGEAWTGETVESRKDGTKFNVRQTITPIRDAEGETTHFISILEDITTTRSAEAALQHLAHYDALTDLPNRVLFNDRYKQALAFARRGGDRLGLMFLDLDRFKEVNDTHGHDIGDLLLKEVAERLRASVRESDTVARLAGDEFTILLPGLTGHTDTDRIAEKILTALAESFVLGDIVHRGGASLGIAVFPDDAADENALLKCADVAMYAAKRSGSNRFLHYRPEMRAGG